jgi:hypothetical protein
MYYTRLDVIPYTMTVSLLQLGLSSKEFRDSHRGLSYYLRYISKFNLQITRCNAPEGNNVKSEKKYARLK